MTKTAIVILNWNGEELLKKYLPSVVDSIQGLDSVELIVADNASTDKSLEVLSNEFPSVRQIVLDKNYGFAAGYNRALQQVDADYWMLLNSDVEVSREWIVPLIEWMDLHEDCGICGPKLHKTDIKDSFEYAGAAGGYIDYLGFPFCRGRVMSRVEQDTEQYDLPAEVFWASGAALMVRAELFRKLGGFSEEFFAHMEEINLCWQARLHGWKVCVVPRSVVYHQGGASLPQNSPKKLFLNHRNNLLMMDRCLPMTLSILSLYGLLSMLTDPDMGPDPFYNCRTAFLSDDKKQQNMMLESACSFAAEKSKVTIFKRMLLDGASAILYLCTGKLNKFKAVLQAHKEFKHNRAKIDAKKMAIALRHIIEVDDSAARVMLTDEPGSANARFQGFGLKGVMGKMMVLQAATKKERIFAYIKDNLV